MKSAVLLLLLPLLLPLSSTAQSSGRATKQDWAAYKRTLENKDEDWYYQGWTQESIDGDNSFYEGIRVAVNTLGKSNQLRAKLPEFKRQAIAAPFDAQAQFRWVYAEWLLIDQSGKIGNYAQLLTWRKALSIPDSPRAFRYIRLRFLITSASASGKYGGDERLIRTGERLLKIKPNDRYISYWLTHLRSNSPSLTDKLKNVSDARLMANAKPKDATAQGSLAGAYMDLWLITKRRSHAQAAVAQYKKYLSLAPPKVAFRSHAEHWIKAIPETQASWEKKGIGKAN